MPGVESARSDADTILLDHAQKDFDAGLAHTRAELRRKHGLIVATTLDGLVMTAVTGLGMRSRMKDDVKLLLSIAHEVAAGADPKPLAEKHLDHVLRLKSKMHLVAREDHADFQRIRAMALELFVKRLPDLAKMVSVKEPASYDDLVRQAFPDRAYVDVMVDENAHTILGIIEHLEKHPHVLRVPSGFAGKIAGMARDMVAWKAGEVKRGVAEIYATKP